MDRRHAFAIFGLPRSSSAASVRRRYRQLVRTWHPDRFAHDPVGAADATVHLRLINEAYRLLTATAAGHPEVPPPSEVSPPCGDRDASPVHLSPEEIERIIAAINERQSPRWYVLPSLRTAPRLYGWRYWFGAAVVVLALIVIDFVAVRGDVAEWQAGVPLIVGLVMWPFLVVYHVIWTRLSRKRDRDSKPA